MRCKLRFEIFERDNFVCQYCGRKPPEVVLEIDHIFPKSKGGKEEKINLITSCKDCNLGKRDKVLKNQNRTEIIKVEIENLKEAETQIKEYYQYLKRITGLKTERNPIVNLIAKTWEKESGKVSSFTDKGKKDIQNLLKRYSANEIIDAIKIVWSKNYIEETKRFSYMCGVLKQIKLRKDNPELARKQEILYKSYYELLNFWKNQPRGTGYLPIYKVKEWLEKGYTIDDIKMFMERSGGIWSDLKISLGDYDNK